MDKIKSMFGGPVAGIAEKVAQKVEAELMSRIDEIKANTEEELKARLKDKCIEIGNQKLSEIEDPSGMGLVQKFGSQAVEKAADKVVDKVWDKAKEKVLKKAA
jgi:hypothetical protein